MNLGELRAALIDGGVTGPHKSHPRASNVKKIHALLEGRGDDFGLTGDERYSVADVLGFMADLTGCDPDVDRSIDDAIDPEKTLEGILTAARRLSTLAGRGGSLLAATGHPTGVLEHYIRIVDAFVRAGGKVSRLREEENLAPAHGRHSEVRYIGGVGVLADWGTLEHTHSAAPMESLLIARPLPDMVLGDHGFAGAAIARGIPTIAIMDINDHALAIAAAEGKDVTIVPLDDNRPPRAYEPASLLYERVLGGVSYA
jgi:hypothetical protein